MKFESYKVWKVLDFGFYMWPDKTTIIRDSVVADNKISLFANIAGPNVIKHEYADNKVIFEDMLVVGQTSNYDCTIDETLPFSSSFKTFIRSPRAPKGMFTRCLLYTSPSPRDKRQSRMPSSA